MIKDFMIFSEPCSGSHFLQYSLSDNFHIDYSNHHHSQRHFFGHENDIYSSEEIESTLFIYLTRDPVEWIDSFFKILHHVPSINKQNINNFVKNEWYSIYEMGDEINTEIMEDRNIFTKERYKNILEMRKIKNDYFLTIGKEKFTHFLILKYEDLRDDYKNTLNKIQTQFQLKPRNEKYKEIVKYKGSYNDLYYKKPIVINDEIQEYIKKNVDPEQEKIFGYIV